MTNRPQHKRVGNVWYRQCSGLLHKKAFIPLDEFDKKGKSQWRKQCRDCIAFERKRKERYTVPINQFKPEDRWITETKDPLVVPTSAVSIFLNNWTSKPGNDLDKLSELSGVPERMLGRIIACESKSTNLSIVDKILTATDYTYLLQTELKPVPNPRWSNERWNEYLRQHGGCEP